MRENIYLIFSSQGFVKSRKIRGKLEANEVEVKIIVDIPDDVFNKPSFIAEMKIDPSLVRKPNIEIFQLEAEIDEIKNRTS